MNHRHRYAYLCGIFVFLFPWTLQKLEFRYIPGIAISIHKSSPAFAALEDLHAEYSNPLEELRSEPMQLLASGQSFDVPKITRQPQQRVVALQGITIRTQNNLRPQPFLVAGLAVDRNPTLTNTRGEMLPLAERKRLLIESLEFEDVSGSSVHEAAQDLIQRELANSDKVKKVIPVKSGNVYVAGHIGSGSNDGGKNQKRAQPPEPEEPSPAMSLVEADTGDQRPLWVTGQIEMTDGLAFMGPETTLTVKRVFQNDILEVGKIDLREGGFEIRVREAVGRLVAELTKRNGEVIGRGEVNLLAHVGRRRSHDRVEGLRIALRPISDRTSIQVISGHSSQTQKFPMDQARVEIDSYTKPIKVNTEGRISDDSLVKDSSFVVIAHNHGHSPTMMVGIAGKNQEVRLYTRPMLEALANLVLDGADRKQAMQDAIVWGRIMMNGQPVAGATVELAGDSAPIYFNEVYVPDRKLEQTTSNGLFSFLLVPTGVQAVRVRYNGKAYPAQIFPSAEHAVSYVELQLQEKVSTQFKIYDMFETSKNLAAHLRMSGLDEEIPVMSGGFVEYPSSANPFIVEADAGEGYELSRVMVSGTPDEVEIPAVKKDWLNAISAAKGINYSPRRGIIVGLIEDQAFAVELSGYGPNEKPEIFYFDSLGNILDSNRGVAGGGFVIFNAPLGLQTLLVHPQVSQESMSQIVVAESSFIHIVKLNFSR